METDGSGRTCNDAGRGGRGDGAGAARLLLGRRTCSSTTTTRARRRSWRRRSGGGRTWRRSAREYERKVRRTVANIEADEVEDRAALDYLARIGWEPMRTELIVATYENPRALALCLDLGGAAGGAAGLDRHRRRRLGAGDAGPWSTRFAAAHPELGVRHVWHEDRGFQKNAILNRAIATLGGGVPGLHRRRRADPAGLPRAPPRAGAAGPLVVGEPDPARRRGDRGGDARSWSRAGGSSSATGCGRTGRSTGSGPG